MYEIGMKLGRYWGEFEAQQQQKKVLQELQSGKEWAASHDDPLAELRRLLDPAGTGFLDVPDVPDQSFVAGFIDGGRSVGDSE